LLEEGPGNPHLVRGKIRKPKEKYLSMGWKHPGRRLLRSTNVGKKKKGKSGPEGGGKGMGGGGERGGPKKMRTIFDAEHKGGEISQTTTTRDYKIYTIGKKQVRRDGRRKEITKKETPITMNGIIPTENKSHGKFDDEKISLNSFSVKCDMEEGGQGEKRCKQKPYNSRYAQKGGSIL